MYSPCHFPPSLYFLLSCKHYSAISEPEYFTDSSHSRFEQYGLRPRYTSSLLQLHTCRYCSEKLSLVLVLHFLHPSELVLDTVVFTILQLSMHSFSSS